MEKNINLKKVALCILIFIVTIIIIILIKLGIDKIVIHNQMKTAINAITINDDVSLYSSSKGKKEKEKLEIGTNVYILDNTTDKNGVTWSKVKAGKKVGYVLSENVKSYKKSTMKKALMLDVSKFNMQNNFSSIGEFKAFILNNNIKYVYIRAGGRGYGEAGNFYTDTVYKEYAEACEYLGIPFGFYFLDEAITSEEVQEEFEFIKDFVSNNSYKYNKLPIALDVEQHVEKGRADGIWDTRYNLVNELIEKIEQDGKKVIIYSNANIANKYLSNVNAKLWLAYYPDNVTKVPNYWYSDITNAEGASNNQLVSKMVAWQFTQTGIKNKIDKNVDLNIVYNSFFSDGDMNDIENDISGKSKAVKKIFNLRNKKKFTGIFSLKNNI